MTYHEIRREEDLGWSPEELQVEGTMKELPENKRKPKEQKCFKKQDRVNWLDAAERSSKGITE